MMRSRAYDLVGTVVGRLRVLSVGHDASKRLTLDCVCACGTHKTIRACHDDEAARLNNVRHGHKPRGHQTAEYRAWANMIDRCERPTRRCYANYGGRGITVCSRWRDSFASFLADMGPRPSSGHSVDRIDVNGNYEPSNCRWATRSQQASNTRTTPRYDVRGERLTATEIRERFGVPNKGFWYRVNTLG